MGFRVGGFYTRVFLGRSFGFKVAFAPLADGDERLSLGS